MNQMIISVLSIFESRYRSLPFMAIAIIGYFLSRNNPYFWDTIQFGSEHAHWYYDHNFRIFLLPELYDSGHPPLFGMYVALWWKIFGKFLYISHLSMLPFTLLAIYLAFKIGDKIVGRTYSVFFVLLCILDPVNEAQHSLVSPDIMIYSGTLLCFYGILYDKKIILLLGTLLLSCISMRGLSVAAAFGLYQCIEHYRKHTPFQWKQYKDYLLIFLPYAPGLLLFVSFMLYHYIKCGWVGYHANSPWAASFEKVNVIGFFRNILVAGFRTIEFGRIGLIVGLVWLIWIHRKRFASYSSLVLLLTLLVICLVIPQLFYKELLGPRYFMPVFMVLSLLFCRLLFLEKNFPKTSYVILSITALILFTGNLWKYPRHIAMGWDASLGHVFYFKARAEMLAYIDAKKIPYEKIGSGSLECGPRENIDLSGKPNAFQPLDPASQRYVYYSNVMNLPDNQLEALFTQFKIMKRIENGPVEVILFVSK